MENKRKQIECQASIQNNLSIKANYVPYKNQKYGSKDESSLYGAVAKVDVLFLRLFADQI